MSRLPRVPFPTRTAQFVPPNADFGEARALEEIQSIIAGAGQIAVSAGEAEIQRVRMAGEMSTQRMAQRLASQREQLAEFAVEDQRVQARIDQADRDLSDAESLRQRLARMAELLPVGVLETLPDQARREVESTHPIATDPDFAQEYAAVQGAALFERTVPAFTRWIKEKRLDGAKSVVAMTRQGLTPGEVEQLAGGVSDDDLHAVGFQITEHEFTSKFVEPNASRIGNYITAAAWTKAAYQAFYRVQQADHLAALDSQQKRALATLDEAMRVDVINAAADLSRPPLLGPTGSELAEVILSMHEKYDGIARRLGQGQSISLRDMAELVDEMVLSHMDSRQLRDVEQGLAGHPRLRTYFGGGGDRSPNDPDNLSIGFRRERVEAAERAEIDAISNAKRQYIKSVIDQVNETSEGDFEQRLGVLKQLHRDIRDQAIRVESSESPSDTLRRIQGDPGEPANGLSMVEGSLDYVQAIGEIQAEINTIESQFAAQLDLREQLRSPDPKRDRDWTRDDLNTLYDDMRSRGYEAETIARVIADRVGDVVPTRFTDDIKKQFDPDNLDIARGVEMLVALRDVAPSKYDNLIGAPELADMGVPRMMEKLDEQPTDEDRQAIIDAFANREAVNDTFFNAVVVPSQENVESANPETYLTPATADDPRHLPAFRASLIAAMEGSGLSVANNFKIEPGVPRPRDPRVAMWLDDFKGEYEFQYLMARNESPGKPAASLNDDAMKRAIASFRDRWVPITTIDLEPGGGRSYRTELVRSSTFGVGSLASVQEDPIASTAREDLVKKLATTLLDYESPVEAHLESAVDVNGLVLVPVMPHASMQDNAEPWRNVVDFLVWMEDGDLSQWQSVGGLSRAIGRQIEETNGQIREAQEREQSRLQRTRGLAMSQDHTEVDRLRFRRDMLIGWQKMAGQFQAQRGIDPEIEAEAIRAMRGIRGPSNANRWRGLFPPVGGHRVSLSEFLEQQSDEQRQAWYDRVGRVAEEEFLKDRRQRRMPELTDDDIEEVDALREFMFEFLVNRLEWLVDDETVIDEVASGE